MKGILQRTGAFVLVFLWATVVSGCGGSVSILKDREAVPVTSDAGNIPEETKEQEETGASDDTALQKKDGTEPDKSGMDSSADTMIFVDVCGAVKTPGVYQLPGGSRIFQAIEMAGGFLEEAETGLVNQAGILEDGQQVRIYTKDEAEELKGAAVSAVGGGQQQESALVQQNTEGKVNINRADKAALMTLNGIGETRAEAIIEYREKTGGFSGIEELMLVDGIKEKIYEKLKDKITVQ